MKTLKLLMLLIASIVFVAAFAPAVSAEIEMPIAQVMCIGTGVVFIAMIAPKKQGSGFVAISGISVELWVKYIQDNLFKDNDIVNKCFNEDSNVLGGSVAHIPQAGAKPAVVKNRSSYPATAVRRADTDVTYPLDVYTTDPTHIPKAELMEISYDKISSVLGEHLESLNEAICEQLLYTWRPEAAASIVRTSGVDTSDLPNATATGTRKKLVKEDIKRAQFIMNKQNISKVDRYLLLPSELYSQLMDDADLIKRDSGAELDMKNGIITRLYGFNIMERGTVLTATNATTPVVKAIDAAEATTDNFVALAFQKNAVAKAMGTVDFFENLRDPQYYGDIYSALVKMGGRKRRANGEGVVGIIQAHGA